MKTKNQVLCALAIASAAFFLPAVSAADQKAPAPVKKPAPKKPSREEITNRVRREHPLPKFPVKTGGAVSFQLVSGATVRGKLEKVTPAGLRINDGVFTFLQKKDTITLKDRAKFYKEDYDLFIKTEVDHIMNPVKVDSSGNKNSIAKPGDKRFPQTTKKGKSELLNKKK